MKRPPPLNVGENRAAAVPGFDPYHVWLGIPPQEQPPNHYRLLGITLFESQPDVIANAADRQMIHLRTFQSGKHSPHSQQLLNEVAAAKVCLLNSARKAAYDEQLRIQLHRAEEDEPDAAESEKWTSFQECPSFTTPISSSARRRRTNLGTMISAAVAGILLLVCLLAWNAMRRSGIDTQPETAVIKHETGLKPANHRSTPLPLANTRHPGENSTASPAPIRPAPSPVSNHSPATSPESVDPIFTTPIPVFEKPREDSQISALPPFDPSAQGPKIKQPTPKPVVKPKAQNPNPLPQLATPIEIKRFAVPDETRQQEIAARLKAEHNPAIAKTTYEKSRLAKQFLQAARELKEPGERYVLLRQSRELAGEAGDMALMFQAIEASAAEFEISATAEKGKSLLEYTPAVTRSDQIRSVYECSHKVIASALAENNHELATELADCVYRLCQRPQAKDFRKRAFDQKNWIRDYCQRQEHCERLESELINNPEDGDAHLDLGQYYCFLDGDWKRGLPHLAKGSDPILQQLAERELNLPTDPSEITDLADVWWNLAPSYKGEERDSILLRAGHWYKLVHEKMPLGLTRVKVGNRLKEIEVIRRRRASEDYRSLLNYGASNSTDLWQEMF